jgi:hypothetical protein
LSLLLKHVVPIFFVGGDDVDTPPWAELATLSLFPSRERIRFFVVIDAASDIIISIVPPVFWFSGGWHTRHRP